jgi:hypothetical protein
MAAKANQWRRKRLLAAKLINGESVAIWQCNGRDGESQAEICGMKIMKYQ